MFSIANYIRPESIEEAWELNQKKANRIIGGMIWMKMSNYRCQTAIDLSALGLDTIEETDTEFRIGCMVTLRMLETHEGLNKYTSGAMRESVRHIVGVQLRNCATVGGSIFSRFGFSDVLTMFMATDSYVELHKGGIVPMTEFAAMKPDNDILVRIIVKKAPIKLKYMSVRNTTTDFPVLTCAAAMREGGFDFVIGARPAKAVKLSYSGSDAEEAAEFVRANIVTGKNMRGSAEYRKHLAGVLVKRTMNALTEEVRK